MKSTKQPRRLTDRIQQIENSYNASRRQRAVFNSGRKDLNSSSSLNSTKKQPKVEVNLDDYKDDKNDEFIGQGNKSLTTREFSMINPYNKNDFKILPDDDNLIHTPQIESRYRSKSYNREHVHSDNGAD